MQGNNIDNNNENRGGGGGGGDIGTMLRTVVQTLYMAIAFQYVMTFITKSYNITTPTPSTTQEAPIDLSHNEFQIDKASSMNDPKKPYRYKNKNAMSEWATGSYMNLEIYLTQELKDVAPLHNKQEIKKQALDSFHSKDLVLDWISTNSQSTNLTIPISKQLLQNETVLYAHLFLSNPSHYLKDYRQLHKVYNLTKYKLRKKRKQVKNLLNVTSDASQQINNTHLYKSVLGKAALNTSEDARLLYLKPSINLQLVHLTSALPIDSLPDFLSQHISRTDSPYHTFYPILHPSDFWITSNTLVAINDTLSEASLTVNVDNCQFWKWQVMTQMEFQWQVQSSFTSEEEEESQADFLKDVLQDTNPYLLAVTFFVSLLHTIFDMLAFKNDISFHRQRKSMEGLSVKTMLVNCFFQIVIFLYLLDNDTNSMVLFSNGISCAIEFWKVSRAIQVEFQEGKLVWKETTSYSESKAKEYDEIATMHLLYVTMPLVAGYAIYSLVHLQHKGWYSWIINTLVGFIYLFGFAMMTPQLFINYKLKSVAHLNWRTMSYKALNTFIDDLFAFVIKMPIMHRLACLRDDVVFMIFLYQRYIYRVDYSRINEFGQVGQELKEEKVNEQLNIEGKSEQGKEEIEKVKIRRGAREKKD